MCTAGAGQQTATIKTTTTKEQEDKARAAAGLPPAKPNASAAGYVENEQKNQDPNNPLGFSVAPPADAPDLTSKVVQQKKAAQALMLLSGRGRAYAFGPGALSGKG
jgi:hypothetical protein